MERADRSDYLRKRIVRVRFNDCEIEALDEMRGGCHRATYLRQLLLAGTRAPARRQVAVRCASMDALVRELNRIGVNMNQIARARNRRLSGMGVLDAVREEMRMKDEAEAFREFRDSVDKLRAQVDGLRADLQAYVETGGDV